MKFGIDAIVFNTSRYYLDLKTLAMEHHQSINRFYVNLGQNKMAIAPPNEDIVTLAASATTELLRSQDTSNIEMVLFATETGIDLAKSAGTYIHRLFNLPKRCRVIELKQACFGATCGLQLGLTWLQQNVSKKVLLLASDIARYELNSIAESSQGCGAVAMLLSANPRILVIEPESGFCTEEVMDFWRPNYLDHALVDGHLSCETYMKFVEETWLQYIKKTGRKFSDHDRFCYHAPLAKLVIGSHKKLARINGIKKLTPEQLDYQIGKSLLYSKEIGNCYTASLYLSIISLLENVSDNISGRLLGLYSYGSGSVGEFFSARVVDGYQEWLKKDYHQVLLSTRQELSFAEYKYFHNFKYSINDNFVELPQYQVGRLCLKAVEQHRRLYEQVK
ncbi:MAG: hydroxymethylglutaryl-CoA synthase [Coxiellaceae bacterium]|jgi:hydroxymethylglutaryl-CoA synthase|nr:hydroxymethylglutaryl-CoA synthase [Coxiellaceae bacterium]